MNLKTIFQILILSTSISANCQSLIEKFFTEITFENLSKSDKISLIKNNKIFKLDNQIYLAKSDIPDNKKNEFHSEFKITEFFPKSGFLSFDENYIYADGGYHYDICYWNKSNGDKLIAVRSFEFATESYDTLEFYLFNNDKTSKININDVLPKLSFDDLLKVDSLTRDGNNKNELQEIFKFISELEFELPKKGKNIIVQSYYKDYDLNDSQQKTLQKFRKYFKKDIILSWNDGQFELLK